MERDYRLIAADLRRRSEGQGLSGDRDAMREAAEAMEELIDAASIPPVQPDPPPGNPLEALGPPLKSLETMPKAFAPFPDAATVTVGPNEQFGPPKTETVWKALPKMPATPKKKP